MKSRPFAFLSLPLLLGAVMTAAPVRADITPGYVVWCHPDVDSFGQPVEKCDDIPKGGSGGLGGANGNGEGPGVYPGIRVLSATYGENCGATVGNSTYDVINDCSGQMSCNYVVDYTHLGDPAPGCAKQFTLKFRCGNGGVRSLTLAAEAGLGSVAPLSCY
jgi:hypothetical protein